MGWGLGTGAGGVGVAGGGGAGFVGSSLDAILGAISGVQAYLTDVVVAARDVVTGNDDSNYAAAGTDFLTPIAGNVDTVKSTVEGPGGPLYDAIGGISGGASASDVWAETLLTVGGSDWEAGELLAQPAAAWQVEFQLGRRHALYPWWVVRAYGTGGVGTEENLNPAVIPAGDPASQGSGESDLDYMNRVMPGLTWHEDWFGTGHVGGNFVTGGFLYTLWYWPEPAADAAGVWTYRPGAWTGTALDGASMQDVMGLVGAETRDEAKAGLQRYIDAPHFLIVGAGYDFTGDGGIGGVPIPGFPSLGDVDPVDQAIDEKDLAFMQRVLPGHLWTSPYTNGALPRYTETDATTGDAVTVMYSPLSRFKHEARQLAYRVQTEQIRPALLDMMLFFSMIPVVFDTPADQDDLN